MRAMRACEPGIGAFAGRILALAAVGYCVGMGPGAAQAKPTTHARQTGSALELRLRLGQRLHYTVSYRSEAGMDMRAALRKQGEQAQNSAPPAIALRTTLRGDIEVTPVRSTAQDTLIACRIRVSAFDMDVNGQAAAEPAAQLRRDLAHPILVRLDNTGHIRELRFDPNCETVTQGVVRTLLAHLQFSTPRNSGRSEWEGREEEPNGAFLARYRRTQSGANGLATIHKTKLPLAGQDQADSRIGVKQTVTPQSDLQIVFDRKQGVIQSVEGVETFLTHLSGTPVARSRNIVSLRLASRETLPTAILAAVQADTGRRIGQTHALSLAEIPGITPRQEAQIQHANLGNANWPALAHALSRVEQTTDAESAARALLVRLKACFYLYPQTCAAAQSLLRSAPADRLPAALLLEALRGAGHERAQQALLAVGRERRNDPRFQQVLLPTLARLERPMWEVETYMRQVVVTAKDTTASSAILALGTLAHTLAATDPARASALSREMVRQLRSARSPERKTDWLLSLGNAGHPSTLAVILGQSHDTSAEVRNAAVLALKHLGGAAADRRLAEALTRDGQSRIRLTAARVAEGRPLSTPLKSALLLAVRGDREAEVRLAAMRSLWRQGRALPEVRASLRSAAEHDASEAVRRAVAQLLSQS